MSFLLSYASTRWNTVCGSKQSISDLTNGTPWDRSCAQYFLGVTKNLRLESLGIQGKPNTIFLKIEQNILLKLLLMIFNYTHRQMTCIAITKEVSFCNRWEQIQRPTVHHYVVWETLGHSVLLNPLGFIQLYRRGDSPNVVCGYGMITSLVFLWNSWVWEWSMPFFVLFPNNLMFSPILVY